MYTYIIKVCNGRLHIEKCNQPFWALLLGLDKLTCMVGRMDGGLHFLVEIELKMAKYHLLQTLRMHSKVFLEYLRMQ